MLTCPEIYTHIRLMEHLGLRRAGENIAAREAPQKILTRVTARPEIYCQVLGK